MSSKSFRVPPHPYSRLLKDNIQSTISCRQPDTQLMGCQRDGRGENKFEHRVCYAGDRWIW